MAKYDGWVIQSLYRQSPDLFLWTFAATRKETIELFDKSWGEGFWKKYRRRGTHEIIKVKLMEVK